MKLTEALRRALDRMVTDLIDQTRQAAQAAGVRDVEDVRRAPARLAGFSAAMAGRVSGWKRFLNLNLYQHPSIIEDRTRSVEALDQVFAFLLDHPGEMPGYFAGQARQGPVHRVVCDYIAGMTDSYLIRLYRERVQGQEPRRGPAA